MSWSNETMTLEFACAMHSSMNIGVGSSREMNRYLSTFFKRRIMPSEQDIFRGGAIAIDLLPPLIKTIQMEDKKIELFCQAA